MANQTFASSPLRLSLFGGGTDIPFVFNNLGKGISITASLDLPVTVGTTTRPIDKGIKLKYSSNEIAYDIESIIHPIFKETLKYFEYEFEQKEGLEIFSTAPIASGSGLGSSAAFTTSLVKCLSYHLKNKDIGDKELLRLATEIEHKSGNDQIGYQDQVASYRADLNAQAAYGERPMNQTVKGVKTKNELPGFKPSTGGTTGHFNRAGSRLTTKSLNVA